MHDQFLFELVCIACLAGYAHIGHAIMHWVPFDQPHFPYIRRWRKEAENGHPEMLYLGIVLWVVVLVALFTMGIVREQLRRRYLRQLYKRR